MSDTEQAISRFSDANVPVIDLSDINQSAVIEQIASACTKKGAFQVINHGVCASLIGDFQRQHTSFFELPHFPSKALLYRFAGNSRGYLDHDFTKQHRDWKECLDIGIPGSRDWTINDSDSHNSCLDGFNSFPTDKEVPGFRATTIKYFQAMEDLSHRISVLMMKGLGVETSVSDGVDGTEKSVLSMLKDEHSSYMRLTHYPPRSEIIDNEEVTIEQTEKPKYFGNNAHSDPGWLTVLLDDTKCLTHQVLRPGSEDEWMTIRPADQSFLILTGDMVNLWSNETYISACYRVLLDSIKHQYSTRFFYNPGYSTIISPCKELESRDGGKFLPCSYGYFRAVRYAEDLAHFGREISVSDYKVGSDSKHPEIQERFLRNADMNQPFNVQNYRKWIHSKEDNLVIPLTSKASSRLFDCYSNEKK